MQGSQGSPPDATEMSGLSYDSLSKHKTDCNKTGRKKTLEALVQLGNQVGSMTFNIWNLPVRYLVMGYYTQGSVSKRYSTIKLVSSGETRAL